MIAYRSGFHMRSSRIMDSIYLSTVSRLFHVQCADQAIINLHAGPVVQHASGNN